MLSSMPGVGGSDMTREMDGVERLSRAGQPGGGGKRPEDMTPEELHATLWQILVFRDNVMRTIESTVRTSSFPLQAYQPRSCVPQIDRIPGLSALVEKISNEISVFVFTTIEARSPFYLAATLSLSSPF
jgi:hypothetical protein